LQGLLDNLKSLGRKTKLIDAWAGPGIGVMLLMILGIGAVTRPDYAAAYSKSVDHSLRNSIEAHWRMRWL